jgi:hypothetical protein
MMTSINLKKTECKNLAGNLRAIILFLGNEHISGTPYRLDQTGVTRVIVEFLAQAAHGNIH